MPLKKHLKQPVTDTDKTKSEKREKKSPVRIVKKTYSSPVCYANQKEEMRADFQDE